MSQRFRVYFRDTLELSRNISSARVLQIHKWKPLNNLEVDHYIFDGGGCKIFRLLDSGAPAAEGRLRSIHC